MKRSATIIALAAASVVMTRIATQTADASTYCRAGGTNVNRSGYVIVYSGARANGMNCKSVRYAQRFFRDKIRGQYGYPRIPHAFWDGYVTWRCRVSGLTVRCSERESGTSYRFQARVYW